MTHQLQTFQNAEPSEIRKIVEGSTISKIVSEKMGVEPFIEAALQLLKQPGLSACTQESVLGGLLKAAIFNFRVSPELGQCWLVPRRVKAGEDEKGKAIYANVAVFQIGYKGWQELAFRSGEVESFDSAVVWENDQFEFEQGTQPFLKYKPCKDPERRGKRTHVWSAATMRSGRVVFNVASIEEIERHRRMSDTQSSWNEGKRQKEIAEAPVGIWALHYDQMAKRIPMRYLCQLQLPKSEMLLKGIESDGGVTNISGDTVIEIPQKEVEENSENVIHEDYIAELENCKTRTSLTEIYNLRKGEFTPEILMKYQEQFKKFWDKLPVELKKEPKDGSI